MKRRALGLVLLLATSGLAGCDDEPSGPGRLEAELMAPEGARVPGAAVLFVSGEGVRGIGTSGETRAFSARVAQSNAFRVVLVNTAPGGPLAFQVEVADVAAPPPTTTVLEVVDTNNDLIPSLGGFEVRYEVR